MLFPGKCLFLSGLIPRPMNADNDRELIGLGIGFTNIVERTTRASQELTRQEIEEGEPSSSSSSPSSSPSQVDTDTMVLIIEQFLLLILIMGRFMMPRVLILIVILKYNFNITTLTG